MAASIVPMVITFYGIGATLTGIASYLIAAAKHRDASHWGFWGFVFPPSLLLTFLLPTLPAEQRNKRYLENAIERRLAERDDD